MWVARVLKRSNDKRKLIRHSPDRAGQRGTGQRGTGQIRRRVKEDENGIGIAGTRSFSSNTGGGGGVANK
jgi:hypothetical protein